jgi:hypothetical protein
MLRLADERFLAGQTPDLPKLELQLRKFKVDDIELETCPKDSLEMSEDPGLCNSKSCSRKKLIISSQPTLRLLLDESARILLVSEMLSSRPWQKSIQERFNIKMQILTLREIAPCCVFVAVSLFSSCVQPPVKGPPPKSAFIEGTEPPKCVFYLPGPDTGSQGGSLGAGWTGSLPSAQFAINWGHNNGYYTYFGDCKSGPQTPIGPNPPTNAPATPLATTNNNVSQTVKQVRQKAKSGSVPEKKAGELLLQAGQFYKSLNKLVQLQPGDSQTPPASKIINNLTQQGTTLASEVVTVAPGAAKTSAIISANVLPASPSPGNVIVTPTPAPRVPVNPNSIISAGQAIINNANSF